MKKHKLTLIRVPFPMKQGILKNGGFGVSGFHRWCMGRMLLWATNFLETVGTM